MKLLVLSILLAVTTIPSPGVQEILAPSETKSVAALPDYNSYRIRKMRALFELRSSPKIFMLKIA